MTDRGDFPMEYAKDHGLSYCQALNVLRTDDIRKELLEAPEKQSTLAEALEDQDQ